MGLFRDNETNNLNGTQLARGKPAGYLQAWPSIWTRDYCEQIQLAFRAGRELGLPDYKSSALTAKPPCLHYI